MAELLVYFVISFRDLMSFKVIYLIGWVPHESQQKAKKRGSATVSLKDLAGVMGKQVATLEEIPDDDPRK